MQPQGQNPQSQGQSQPSIVPPAIDPVKQAGPSASQSPAPQQPGPSAMPMPAVNTVSPEEQPKPMPQPAVNTVSTPDQAAPPPAPPAQNSPDDPSQTAAPAPQVQLQPNLVQPSTVVQPNTSNTKSESKAESQSQEQPNLDQSAPKQTTEAPKEVNATDTFIKGLVYLQFFTLFIILVGFFPGPLFFSTLAMVSGALLMGAGLFLGIWAVMSFRQKISPNPKPLKHSFLVTGGPYKYMRHPMYAAIILAAVGLTLVYPTIIRVIAVLILILVIISKMNIEEYLLAKRYHHYARYQRITGKMIPKFKKPDIDIDIDLPNFER